MTACAEIAASLLRDAPRDDSNRERKWWQDAEGIFPYIQPVRSHARL